MSTIREFQRDLPWGAHEYGEPFMQRQDPQRDAHHALLHIHKASGKLAGLLDACDHSHFPTALAEMDREAAGKYLADLVICAARLAKVYPGGAIDLQDAIDARTAEKFPKGA